VFTSSLNRRIGECICDVTILQNVTSITNIFLTQESMILSVQRHNKMQYQIKTNSLQSSYGRLYHAAVPQAMSRNINIPQPLSDDTPEYNYKEIDNRDVLTNSHIPNETEPSDTHFLFTENTFT